MPRTPNQRTGRADAVLEYRATGGPTGTLRVHEPEAVKALLDPRRQRLLKHLVRPRSVKEIADEVGESPSRLYYHVRLLERHGIVRAVAQRRAGSNTEHVYQLAARRFEVAAGLAEAGLAGGSGITPRLMETAQRYGTAMDEGRKGRRREVAIRAVHEVVHPLTHEQAKALWARMEQVIKELPKADADAAPHYGLHVMMAPLRPAPGETP